MKNSTLIGLIVIGIIAYLYFDKQKAKASPKSSGTPPQTPPVEPTEPTDTVAKTTDDAISNINEMTNPNEQSPYTCIVYNQYGQQMTVTSPTNSLWFRLLCSGQISYPYMNYYYYSPIWWRRHHRPHHHFPRPPHTLPNGGHHRGARFGGGGLRRR